MADEEWKNIPVIDGKSFSKYEVSSLGRIRNKESVYVLSDRPNQKGYVCNTFYDDEGKTKTIPIHNIVTRAFLGEPKSVDLTPDHINRKPSDNRVTNLRWATRKQQVANSNRSKCKPRGQPVVQYTMEMKKIKRWPNITTAADELKIHKSNITQACKGKLNQARGYKWAYERQDLDGEIWKEYKPFDVLVSNMGRIKSSHRHIVYGSKTGDYMIYGEPGKLVHIIVAETFLPNPENKPEVNHKDKDGTNNKLENLEWATSSENMFHSHRTNSNPNRYSASRAVKQYDLEGNFIGEYKSTHEASRQIGCQQTSISRVCLGLSKSTKGYVFKYANKDVLNRPATKCSKNVDLIDEKGNVIETYESARAASLNLEISDQSIYEILRGKRKKTRGGYRFRYH
uniref:HNH endonuclease n=1 Tax=Marseillevirus LCMAC101 TaxID=2506602 RepID=A0A481YT67_9VIRU|nr:MAG: HNH endonuclease [Marseillevirus LCMAC101]